jgi:hypothetical protein
MRNVRKSTDSHSYHSYRFASGITFEGKCGKNHRIAAAAFSTFAVFRSAGQPFHGERPQTGASNPDGTAAIAANSAPKPGRLPVRII